MSAAPWIMIAVAAGTLGVAWGGHHLATWPVRRRARLLGALARPQTWWIGAALLVIGLATGWAWRGPASAPRRYADYQPVGTGPAADPSRYSPLVASLLCCAGAVLVALWFRARHGRARGGVGATAREAATAVGGLIVLAGVAAWFHARSLGLASFGWYMYSPLTGSGVTDLEPPGRQAWNVAGTALTAAGLAVLAAVAGHRQGRRDRHPTP